MEELRPDLKSCIHDELEDVPDESLPEVLDFVQFLKARHASRRMQPAVASEPALARDWLRLEEESAWSDL